MKKITPILSIASEYKLTDKDTDEVIELLKDARGYLLFVIKDKKYDWHSRKMKDAEGVYLANAYIHAMFEEGLE